MSKININIPIMAEMLRLVVDENDRLSRSFESNYVDFSEASRHSPHVSLYMGEIDLDKYGAALFDIIRNNIGIFSGFVIESSNISITDPDRRGSTYVFVDIEPTESLLRLKNEVWGLVGHLFSSPKWFYLDETPHVTIGCVTDSKASLERFYNLGKIPHVSQVVTEIRVSEVGPRGTCVGKIEAWSIS